jgi:hypothetical protein
MDRTSQILKVLFLFLLGLWVLSPSGFAQVHVAKSRHKLF